MTRHHYAILLNIAAIAVVCATLAACPRNQPGTAPSTPAAPSGSTAKTSQPPAAATDLKLPLDYLELGGGMTAAPVPADVLASFPDAQVNADKSKAHVSFPDQGMDYWYMGFTSLASMRDLNNYYNGILSLKEFEPDSEVNNQAASGEGSGTAQLLFNTPDAKFGVRVYPADPDAASAGEQTAYVLFIQDRSKALEAGT